MCIRDRDPEELASQLCRYYDERNLEDVDRLPKVTRKNVLILKYYSFENYFFNPAVMARLGIVESEDVFYRTLYGKWREYLYRIRSGQQLMEVLGRDFSSPEDMKEHMEEVRTFLSCLLYTSQQAADQGIANANPGGGQAVFPSELTGITDKYHSGKVGGAVGKGGEPGPHTPSSQNKVIDIGGMATGIESHSQHDGKKDNQHQQFNSHLNILRIHFNN